MLNILNGGLLVAMFATTILSIVASWYGCATIIKMIRPSAWDYAPAAAAALIVIARAPAVISQMQRMPVAYPEAVIVDLLLKFAAFGTVALIVHIAAEESGVVAAPEDMDPIQERVSVVDDATGAEAQSTDGRITDTHD